MRQTSPRPARWGRRSEAAFNLIFGVGARMRLGFMALALLAAACGPQGDAQPSAGAPSVTPQQAAAVASYGHDVTREALIGRWTDNRNCTQFIEFREDGTFRSFTGGTGTWTLTDSRVTITGESGSFVLILRGLSDGTMEATDANGAVFLETRC